MTDLYPINKADWYEIDYYSGRRIMRTEKFKFIEDVKEALSVPLELYDCSLAIPYTVYDEGKTTVRFPFNPNEV